MQSLQFHFYGLGHAKAIGDFRNLVVRAKIVFMEKLVSKEHSVLTFKFIKVKSVYLALRIP